MSGEVSGVRCNWPCEAKDVTFRKRLMLTLAAVGSEVNRAESLHKPINSHHEAYAVIREELEEFTDEFDAYWAEVKKRAEARNVDAMRTELVQMAAMCVRTILNVIEQVDNAQCNDVPDCEFPPAT